MGVEIPTTPVKREGWILRRQKGSHRPFSHPDFPGRRVTVAGHPHLDIPKGTLNRIGFPRRVPILRSERPADGEFPPWLLEKLNALPGRRSVFRLAMPEVSTRLSTMSAQQLDANLFARIARLARQVMEGGPLSRSDAEWLFSLERPADIFDLLAWANRLREHFKGNQIHLCSILNAKAGGCPEDCRFCAQSARYSAESPRHTWLDSETLMAAAREAHSHGIGTLDLVAAWKGLHEGALLDEICQSLEQVARSGLVRPDASLGLIPSQTVADRLKRAGVVSYNHNLETSRRFFPRICSTHAYDDRVQTIRFLQQAGIRICSGGLIGMGETREDRCDLAFALKELEVDIVPINVLNPIPGTPFANVAPVPPLEILQTIACFRFILPRQDILIAGGRSVNLRDLQGLVFMAGASALMVGNYLTTAGNPVEKDLQMLKDLGLEPRRDCHPPSLLPVT